MKLHHLYLALAIIGIVLPFSQFIPATVEGTFSIANMVTDLSATRIVSGFTLDLTVAAAAGLLFIVIEARRLKIRFSWIAVLGTFLIGFSFGLPFFLFLRERGLAARAESS
jgi:hypothetical protein